MGTDNESANGTLINSNDCVFPSSGKQPIDSDLAPVAMAQADKKDAKIIEQFKQNENNKRNLKPTILLWVCIFIIIQLVFMNLILLIVVISLVVGEYTAWFIHAINLKIVPNIFEFLKFILQ